MRTGSSGRVPVVSCHESFHSKLASWELIVASKNLSERFRCRVSVDRTIKWSNYDEKVSTSSHKKGKVRNLFWQPGQALKTFPFCTSCSIIWPKVAVNYALLTRLIISDWDIDSFLLPEICLNCHELRVRKSCWPESLHALIAIRVFREEANEYR